MGNNELISSVILQLLSLFPKLQLLSGCLFSSYNTMKFSLIILIGRKKKLVICSLSNVKESRGKEAADLEKSSPKLRNPQRLFVKLSLAFRQVAPLLFGFYSRTEYFLIVRQRRNVKLGANLSCNNCLCSSLGTKLGPKIILY